MTRCKVRADVVIACVTFACGCFYLNGNAFIRHMKTSQHIFFQDITSLGGAQLATSKAGS